MRNLTSMEDLTTDQVMTIITRGIALKNGAAPVKFDRQIFASNLFFENSTRTHHSFHIAERKLGLDVLEFDANVSSINKGETLYDTVLTLCALRVEVCVIRSGEENYYEELVKSDTLVQFVAATAPAVVDTYSRILWVYECFHFVGVLKINYRNLIILCYFR